MRPRIVNEYSKRKFIKKRLNVKPKNELEYVSNHLKSKLNAPSVNISMNQIRNSKKWGRKMINKNPNLKQQLASNWVNTTDMDDFINRAIDSVGLVNLINNEENQVNFGGAQWGCSSGGYGPPPDSVGTIGNHYGGNNHGDCIKFLITMIVILMIL